MAASRTWRRGELNPRPFECHSNALPTELRPRLRSRFLPISSKSIQIQECLRMSESIEDLQKKLKIQNDIIKGYEKVLRLNEQELENADEIIRMYEGIIQYSGKELKDVKEAFDATNVVTNLSREELMSALSRIKELENVNKKLREEALKFQTG